MGEVQKRRRSSVSLDAIKPYRRNGSTTAGSLHEHLRRLILDGAIPNGASISQVELAERLGVSRTPLREAMRRRKASSTLSTAGAHASPPWTSATSTPCTGPAC